MNDQQTTNEAACVGSALTAELATAIKEEKNRARYEAIGWTHALCCAALDDGRDPRQIDCAEIMEMAQAQLGG